MTESLRALLSGAIDYAGLFPPAKLPLEETVRNYARYVQCDDAWMLGRLIIPAGRLNDLLPLIGEPFNSAAPLKISVLMGGGETSEAFASLYAADSDAVDRFRASVAGRAVIDVAEIKLPAITGMNVPREPRLSFFFESAELIVPIKPAGLKFRTGGVEASAFPSPRKLARAILHARKHRLPIKFTAGLHHPIRLFHPSVNTKMFGFINVYLGAMMAEDEDELVRFLECEDPKQVKFSNEGVEMLGKFLPAMEIGRLRKSVTSFGSCSFDEPREDLRLLGWL